MRELTSAELEFISGGTDTDVEDIVVTGSPYPPPYYPPYYPPSYPYYGGGNPPYYPGGGYPPPPPPPDADVHDVTSTITRVLTADEQQALKDFEASVKQADAWVKSLPDNAQLRLSNGQIVTGAEYKEAWSKTDFQINEIGTGYRNGTTRGEADYNNGNPVVRLNIDIVNGYNNLAGGTDYLVLHEVAHLTSDQRSNLSTLTNDGNGYTASDATAHERMANDIARAVVMFGNGTVMANPGEGYDPATPTFQVPTS